VKAVEYLVRDRLETLGLAAVAELTHFACTSEDINSASYALTVKRAVEQVWLPKLRAVISALGDLAREHRDAAMLSRTHGQPRPRRRWARSSPCSRRLDRVAAQIEAGEYLAKFSGATGTWSAHLSAAPDVDWPELSREFIEGLGIGFNMLTTQIESHDWQVELYDRVRHAGGILHNLATDIWTYISMGFFAQIPVAGATGSSTMPHKINPIRFENAEANLEISGGCSDPGIHPRHEPHAARPHRLDDAAQHRRRLRALAARARQPAAGLTEILARATCCWRTSTPTGRCSPRRSRPSCAPRSSPALADHRPVRPPEGAHPRAPRRHAELASSSTASTSARRRRRG
jgi:hypothetical protein